MKRKALNKTIRFEMFKRDEFTCQYCGRKPPAVILEIDHIIPVSAGGNNDIANLITACFDCNRGKKDKLLTNKKTRSDLKKIIAERKESEEQLKEYYKFLEEEETRILNDLEFIVSEWESYDKNYTLSPKARASIKIFLKKLPRTELSEAIAIAFSKDVLDFRKFNYFCGICWNKIKEQDHGKK